MTETPSLTLRAATADDVAPLHALSVEAGWPHRAEDWRVLMGLGRGVVAGDPAGRVVGCAAWWPFGPQAASVGMVIVPPALQGRGIGGRLMARILAEAGPRRLHLHATEAGRRLYEREGFAACGVLRQHQGIASPGTPPDGPGRVRPIGPGDRRAVRELDRAGSGMERGAMLDALLRAGTGRAYQEGGRVTGYAMTRPFGRGRVVGPLVAEHDAAATALLDAALEEAAGTFLRADTPVEAGPFRDRLAAAGLQEVATALAMVRGVPPPPGAARIYCVAAQALG